MNFTMEIVRLGDGRYRVMLYDSENMKLAWVSPRYRFLWAARFFGRRDAQAHIRRAYSIKACITTGELTYIEKRDL
jgi:hypothetical protein